MAQARHQNLQETQQVRRGQLQQRLQGLQHQQSQSGAPEANLPPQQARRLQPGLQKSDQQPRQQPWRHNPLQKQGGALLKRSLKLL